MANETPPDLNWSKLVGLLTEARDHVSPKPWDEDTCLHARISYALGLPIEYAENWRVVEALEEFKKKE